MRAIKNRREPKFVNSSSVPINSIIKSTWKNIKVSVWIFSRESVKKILEVEWNIVLVNKLKNVYEGCLGGEF